MNSSRDYALQVQKLKNEKLALQVALEDLSLQNQINERKLKYLQNQRKIAEQQNLEDRKTIEKLKDLQNKEDNNNIVQSELMPPKEKQQTRSKNPNKIPLQVRQLKKEFRLKIEDFENQKNELEANLKKTTDELNELRNDNESLTNQIKLLNLEQQNAIESKHNALQKELHTAHLATTMKEVTLTQTHQELEKTQKSMQLRDNLYNATIVNYETLVAKLQKDLKETNELKAAKDVIIDNQKQEYEHSLTEQMQFFNDQINLSQNEISELKNISIKLKKENELLKSEKLQLILQAEEEINKKNVQINDQNKQLSESKNTLFSVGSENKKLLEKAKTLEEKIYYLKLQNNEYMQALKLREAKSREESFELQQYKSQVLMNFEKQNHKISEQEQTIESQKQIIRYFESKVPQLEQSLEEQYNLNDAMKQQLEGNREIEITNIQLIYEISHLKQLNNQNRDYFNAQHTLLQNQNQKLLETIKENDTLILNLNKEKNDLNNSIITITAEFESKCRLDKEAFNKLSKEMTEKSREFDSTFLQLQDEKKILTDEKSKLTEEISRLNRQIEQTKAQLDTINTLSLTQMQKEKQELQNTIELRDKHISNVNLELLTTSKYYADALNNSYEKIEELTKQNHNLTTENNLLNDKIIELSSQRTNSNEQQMASDAEKTETIVSLTTQINRLKKANEILRTKVQINELKLQQITESSLLDQVHTSGSIPAPNTHATTSTIPVTHNIVAFPNFQNQIPRSSSMSLPVQPTAGNWSPGMFHPQANTIANMMQSGNPYQQKRIPIGPSPSINAEKKL